ncbi:MAG: helix-turn-helix domain-containing protein [Ardenticatenales bacterium]|nr:helix-turn-helix domain-containing protein [Ardenticatenales bacterium]
MSSKERLLLRNRILGVLIRDARLAAGKSQGDCSAFLGIPTGRFSDIERGARPISLPELEGFAHLVDVPVEHFFGDRMLEDAGGQQLPMDELLTLRNRVVGALLRTARLALGRTQHECGRKLRVPVSRISTYEYGQTAIPLTELEVLAEFLQTPLDTFLDHEYNPIHKRMRQTRALEHLPEDVQAFVVDPLNTDYLQTSIRLSKMPAEELRGIAEALLEITY